MLQKNRGADIIVEIGGINGYPAAAKYLETVMSPQHLARVQQIQNHDVLIKIANAVAMCSPDHIFVNTGSQEDRQFIRALSLKKGEETSLPMPQHTIHYDLPEEQGRIIDRTFYIANPDEQISSLANRMDRSEALVVVREKMAGIMKGQTMIVGFYVRGPIGSPVSNPALEITSSAYVSHSAEILYRNAFHAFDQEIERSGLLRDSFSHLLQGGFIEHIGLHSQTFCSRFFLNGCSYFHGSFFVDIEDDGDDPGTCQSPGKRGTDHSGTAGDRTSFFFKIFKIVHKAC